MHHDRHVDLRSQCCAEPIRRLAKELQGMTAGQVLRVDADMDSLITDIPAFCRVRGEELAQRDEEAGVTSFWIRRTGIGLA